MYERVLDLLIEYYLNLPKIEKGEYWNKELFQQKSYTAWAVQEIYNEVESNPDKNPLKVIEQFISKMDEYSCKDNKTSFVFSIAYDAGMDIYDQLLTMKAEEFYI